MVHPRDIAFLDETEEWRTSRERLNREDRPHLRNLVPGASEPGPSTRIFDQPRERERTMTQGATAQGNSPRED
jgi:hypothetical protein